ncbi:MAG TPA: HD domain-containing protein [Candidatus Dormibacteraeota bacterium]|nr:HD domain-containing protein [Candidatus Dormibacteraeota bacterium]
MAELPVPGPELTAADTAGEPVDPEAIGRLVPEGVLDLLRTLWSAGHSAYVVGGSLRDALLGRVAEDWDLASDALPERTVELLPGAVYENRFGTVAVRRDGETYEITTFRSDHDYADFRRPHRVEFGTSLEADLARRDFTVNAMAWGAPGSEASPGSAGGTPEPSLVDPFGGRADVAGRTLRAVGEPLRRFEEDALRMVRAVRLAATLDFEIEPATLDGIKARSSLVAHLSGERIAAELGRLLAAPRPSVGLRLLADTGLLGPISPELAAQPGIAQNKVEGEDLWDHTLGTVDAAISHPVVRLAALVHDIGKPATAADGHFYGHEAVGAELARAFLDRLHEPRAVTERVTHLVRNHMFGYEPSWSDTAVRRFIGKVGPDAIDELFALREADNVGSGLPRSAGGLSELKARVAAELAEGPVLDRSALAIDGDDLMAELGLEPGPGLGRVLEALLQRVIEDKSLNTAPTLLLLARQLVADDR